MGGSGGRGFPAAKAAPVAMLPARAGQLNIIQVPQRGPLPCPLLDDIITEEHFYDLIMGSFESVDDRKMQHFGLTPFDEIQPG